MAKWTLDKAHSEIEFKVKHMMISTVKGQFEEFDLNIINDSDILENSAIELQIKTDSLNTKNEQRDEHLRNADFFDHDNFPYITFQSSKIEKIDDDEYKLSGNLTIKGITKPIKLDVEFGGIAKDPWGNQKVGYTVKGKINRQDFGLTWNATLETGGVMVSDEVKFQAEMQLSLSQD
ncbi:YceI family protein [Sphingobacterium sp. UT-1RO-CII-1]|uniref:YceI family protein n=1 Tax=Sphingobacterium sp. UT-1RO-CII-1 TaxID=2995225 RepID=UPI002DD43971|nr:YceI family protein [Sphingobacterium sp. UT-1RO-CII-1]